MKTLKPRNGLVTIRLLPKESETRTKSGIIIPHTRGHMFELAEIVAVGPGVPDYGDRAGTDDLSPGMLVLIKSGVRQGIGEEARSIVGFTLGSGEIHLINQQDIFCIVEDDGQPEPETAKPASSLILSE